MPSLCVPPILDRKLPSCGAAGGRIRGAPWWSRRFFPCLTVQRNVKSGAREELLLMRRGVRNANFVFGTRLDHLPSGSRAVNREAARSACFAQEPFGLIPPTHLHRLLLVSKQLSHESSAQLLWPYDDGFFGSGLHICAFFFHLFSADVFGASFLHVLRGLVG